MKPTKGCEQENKVLNVKVKLTETDIFKELLKECNSILEDERIDKDIRKEYKDRFENIFNETFNKQVD